MKKNTFILSIVKSLLLVLLYFSNNSYAIQENKNVDTFPLQGINFQQLDSSICQNIAQIEIPSITEYPLEINFDIKSINLPCVRRGGSWKRDEGSRIEGQGESRGETTGA